jgi:exocyst complex component 5
MMNQLGSSSNPSSAGQASQAAAALMRFGGIGAAVLSNQLQSSQDRPGEEPLRDEDGQLSVETAEKMLKWHAEAVGRCVEMSAAADMYVMPLFSVRF